MVAIPSAPRWSSFARRIPLAPPSGFSCAWSGWLAPSTCCALVRAPSMRLPWLPLLHNLLAEIGRDCPPHATALRADSQRSALNESRMHQMAARAPNWLALAIAVLRCRAGAFALRQEWVTSLVRARHAAAQRSCSRKIVSAQVPTLGAPHQWRSTLAFACCYGYLGTVRLFPGSWCRRACRPASNID